MKKTTSFLLLFISVYQVLHADTQPPVGGGGVPDASSSVAGTSNLSVLLNQLAVVNLIVQVRARYFPEPAAQTTKEAVECLLRVDRNLAMLCGDKAYNEVSWFIDQIANAVGNVGVDLQQGNDISSTIDRLYVLAGVPLPEETRLPLPTPFCWILMREIYKNLADALRLIPTITTIVHGE